MKESDYSYHFEMVRPLVGPGNSNAGATIDPTFRSVRPLSEELNATNRLARETWSLYQPQSLETIQISCTKIRSCGTIEMPVTNNWAAAISS